MPAQRKSRAGATTPRHEQVPLGALSALVGLLPPPPPHTHAHATTTPLPRPPRPPPCTDGASHVRLSWLALAANCPSPGALCYALSVVCAAHPSWPAAGELLTWGFDDDGRLGHGTPGHQVVPKRVESLVGHVVNDVSCGCWHTAALCADGALKLVGVYV